MDELTWAREVLLRKVPAPAAVTDNEARAWNLGSRNGCKGGCDRNRGFIYRGQWAGYCWSCAERERQAEARERRRQARTDRRCASCDETFTPARSDGRYCSPKCRQRAYRARAVHTPVIHRRDK